MTTTFRRFLIENSIGEVLDLSASPDLFAFNPEGLGVSIDNDFVASGGSFLVNKRTINPNEITLNLLLGAQAINPYEIYAEFIRILSNPPYNLIYITPVGEWRRSCVVNELSKSEINPEFSVMMEQVIFKCTTPWFNYVNNQFPDITQQMGDGKIYSKHTNWKYATDGYKSAPITGYKQNEYWLSNPNELFPGKNLARNMYYDELSVNVTTQKQSILSIGIINDNPEWLIFEADVDCSSLIGSSILSFGYSITQTLTASTKHVSIKISKPSGNTVILDGGSGSVIFKNIYITYVKAGAINLANGKYSAPLYWNSRDKNLLGDQTGVQPKIFTTTDGNSDARLNYELIPAVYPKHQPYIYEAEYKFDYRFGDWFVVADRIRREEINLSEGNVVRYSGYFGNSGSSQDDITVRLVVYDNEGLQAKVYNSNVVIKPGNYEMVVFTGVEFYNIYNRVEVQIVKKNKDIKVLTMGATYGSKRIYIDDDTPVLLTTTKTRGSLLESDWILAENPEKTPDGEYYGYIYSYVYDGDEKPANTFLVENNSLYLRTAVSSPCEITIYGPAVNPRWELLVDSQVKFNDGFNLTVAKGYKLVVSSLPNEQKAVLVDPYGNEVNVYQQQNLSMTNFIKIPPGLSIFMVYNVDGNIEFRYREERDVV